MTSQRVAVRSAVVADAEAVERVRAASWRSGYRGIVPDAFLASFTGDVDARRRYLADPPQGGAELVATDRDEVIGWIAAGATRDEEHDAAVMGEIYACYVAPAHWGRGVGGLLLSSALRSLERGGRTRVILWVLKDNPRARAFYASAGFRPDGAEQLLDLGGPVLEVRLRRALPVATSHTTTDGVCLR